MSENRHENIVTNIVNRNSPAQEAPAPPPASHNTTALPPPDSSSSTISNHIGTLTHLDDEYVRLKLLGDKLQLYLNELEREERSLKLALEQSSTSLRVKREMDARKKEDMALARLEAALMADSDSEDGSSRS